MNPSIYFEVVADHTVANEIDFNKSTQEVTLLFTKNFKQKVKGVNKLVISLATDKDYLFNPPVKMFPIVIIDKPFDFNNYWSVSEQDRKKIILETLYESIKDMCEKMKLELSLLKRFITA